MELRAIVLMIVKIVISIPTISIVSRKVECAKLMGGHLDNSSKTNNFTNLLLEEIDQSSLKEAIKKQKTTETPPFKAETIPDPSPLVVPGYNLPENLFNRGKPFYLEKNPVTGEIEFPAKAQDESQDDYEYYDEPSPNLFDKSKIDRKDGNVASHKYNDVNQLTPNFDFFNLPVKYNPEKYVYPLISSSYANTKVQGNVNRFHNHKDYTVTTYKPTKTPTYVSTRYSYFGIDEKSTTTREQPSTTTSKPTTTATTEVYLTTPEKSLMDSPMNHPSFQDYSTEKKKVDDIFLTTAVLTTTQRTLSLYEHFFGSYDDIETTTNKIEDEDYNINGHAGPYNHNILTGSNMAHYEYEYDDGVTDNIAVENQPIISQVMTTNKENIYETSTKGTTTSTTAQTTTKESSTAPTTTATTPKAITTAVMTTTRAPTTTTTTTTTTPKSMTAITTTTEEAPIEIRTEGVRRKTYIKPTTLHPPFTPKVTSMPLGDFYNNQPIIVATQNLRDQLNSEKVPKPFEPSKIPPAPSSSNIRIPADQNTVSFVIGNQQSVGNEYAGFKEGPFDNKPFRPVYTDYGDTASYQVQTSINIRPQKPFNIGASSIMHPIKNAETSLAIGVPIDMIQKKPGQVVDDSMEIHNAQIEFPKGNGPKIVFPDEHVEEKQTQISEQLKEGQNYQIDIQNNYQPLDRQNLSDRPNYKVEQQSPPTTTLPNNSNNNIKKHYNTLQINREVLKLNSKPMLHQLPSDLTPPSEPVTRIHLNRERPPWDPRPGHFHAGRPEYARPPRPNDVYKRIDNLPNILPQFRPNIKPSHYFDHHPSKGYIRQPLLDRPSNRPIGFFEKLQPPPPPKNLHNLRKIPQLEQQSSPPPQQQQQQQQDIKPRNPVPVADDRIMNKKSAQEQYMFYQTPPKMVLASRRNGDADVEVETLQMIQAKQEKVDKSKDEPVTAPPETVLDKEKPIYVVYPVNAAPVKLDALDTNKKETVVIGKRAELPLPPSQIQDFDQSEFNLHERHELPILKPHLKPSFPTKTDFPYPLERPDPSLLSAPDVGNNIDNVPKFETNNWDTIGDADSKPANSKTQQISVKLKTYTEKPIAVAYTPTEPHRTEKYSAPNYANPVIPEIRNSEITVSAVMRTKPHQNEHDASLKSQIYHDKYTPKADLDNETPNIPKLDFQAPFQASVNIDNISSNGWSIVRDRSKQEEIETTTLPIITTSKFDIENFNPPLIGGFKPIYDFLDEDSDKEKEIKEREE